MYDLAPFSYNEQAKICGYSLKRRRKIVYSEVIVLEAVAYVIARQSLVLIPSREKMGVKVCASLSSLFSCLVSVRACTFISSIFYMQCLISKDISHTTELCSQYTIYT